MESFTEYIYKNKYNFRNVMLENQNDKILDLENKINYVKHKLKDIKVNEEDEISLMNTELFKFYIKGLEGYKELLTDGYNDKDIKVNFVEFLKEGRQYFLKKYCL